MFSGNFTVSDTYSLTTKEYLFTSDLMPYVYTSLFDDQYLPVLDEEVKEKLNKCYNYKSIQLTGGEPAGRKNLVIKHVGDEIKEFEIQTRYSYPTLGSKLVFWRHFCNNIGCPEFISVKEKIDKMTSATSFEKTHVLGLSYDKDANPSSIIIFDSSYDVAEYETNAALSKVNDYCGEEGSMVRGIIAIGIDSRLSMRLNFNYPTFVQLVNDVPRVKEDTPRRRSWHIDRLLSRGLLTEEQAEFIRSKVTANSTFDLEFFVESGEITDIHLKHYKILCFKDLTAA